MLRALVEYYVERPGELPPDFRPGPTQDVQIEGVAGDPVVRAAVAYVGGMTDRFAFRTAGRRARLARRRPAGR